MKFRTEQEEFWTGDFGNSYSDRNVGDHLVAANIEFFGDVLRRADGIQSVCELGANIGLNVRAIRQLLPQAAITAVEINEKAARKLAGTNCTVIEGSILDLEFPPAAFDLVFTKGVLIHINPEELTGVYDLMASSSRKFVLMAEYYNPVPVTITYRGNSDRLFKRDFAGEFLDGHPEYELVDYGFRYHRGPFPQDDFNWFLMRRIR